MTEGVDDRPHSSDYFGDFRDHIWNRDFLTLMAWRWGVDDVRNVLDVGCGRGDWARTLLPVLPANSRIIGVDREPRWVRLANQRAEEGGYANRFGAVPGPAEALPFEDGAFDMVTCQTLLMHVADPALVVREMRRILRPGGLIVTAEPNNRAGILVRWQPEEPGQAKQSLAICELMMTIEQGRAKLGEGHNSIGDLVPSILAAEGFAQIRVYQSDRPAFLLPPYDDPGQRAWLAAVKGWAEQAIWAWPRDVAQRYYLAGGGVEEDFAPAWQHVQQRNTAVLAAIGAGVYATAGGAIHYLASGRKPG